MALDCQVELICDVCGSRSNLPTRVELNGGLIVRIGLARATYQVTQTGQVNYICSDCQARRVNQNGDIYGPPTPAEIERAMLRMARPFSIRQEYPLRTLPKPGKPKRALSANELAELDGDPLPEPLEGSRAGRLRARKQPLED